MTQFPDSADRASLGFSSNKEVPIRSIVGLQISKFRTIENQPLVLGQNVTVLAGRNGTMKTSMMGLIAHPFSSEAEDAFGGQLKTKLSEVFRLSPEFDQNSYSYDILIDVGKSELLRETVSIYWVGDKTNRHRVVVSGSEKGDGNLAYNTSVLNLKRLFPLVETRALPDDDKNFELTANEARELKHFLESVLPSSDYSEFTPVHERKVKTTFAPSGDAATYDWRAISSGEDNLGAIFNRLLGFQRSFQKGQSVGNGILCIDEFESSLHPVAQIALFQYLYDWSLKYKVQVVISTHSLHLIRHTYLNHKANLTAGRVVVNFLSKANAKAKNYPIIRNPAWKAAYTELTFETPAKAAEQRRIKVFCEDEHAVHFSKKLLKKQALLRLVEFHSSLDPESAKPGTSYTALSSLCIQFPLLLEGALVLFDADVPSAVTDKIKNKTLFLQLPDDEGLSIERRIIKFILTRENHDNFFVKFDKEKERFQADFKKAGVASLTPNDIGDENVVSIKSCKNWADSDKAAFRQYVTYYAGQLDAREAFTAQFVGKLNKLITRSGIPPITLDELQ